MELAVTQLPKLITIRHYYADEFRDDLVDAYLKICGWNKNSEIPSDSYLIEMLEEYCYQIASLEEFSDTQYYRTIEDEEKSDAFYSSAINLYFADFSQDVRTMGKSQHLFFYSNEDKKYINTPVKEVW